MDERIAQGARHLLVDFRDDDFGGLGRAFGQADFDAEAAKSMFVRRRNVD